MRRLAFSILVTCSALLFACGSDPGDEPGTGVVPLAQACTRLAETQCELFRRCDLVDADEVRSCVAAYPCSDMMLGTLAAVEAGEVVYDGAAMGRCLGSIRTASCMSLYFGDLIDESPDCRASMQGTRAPGEPCVSGGCDGGYCDSWECEPVCVATLGEGDPCEYDDCEYPFHCIDGVCAPPPGEGRPCDPYDHEDACAAGLVCVGDEESATCVHLLAEGADCSAADAAPCDFGLRCDGAACRPRSTAGAPCDERSDCHPGYDCVDGSCARTGRLGDPCIHDPEGYEGGCFYLYVCSPTGVCAVGTPVGSPCDATTACGNGGSCVEGFCRREAWSGEACDEFRICEFGTCTDGRCPGWCGE